jgi:hypothetical protein
MPPIMHLFAAGLAALTVGCGLDPLVKDTPGASAHLLPKGATVPSVADNAELANQIVLNDGVDEKLLMGTGGAIPRGTGSSAGDTVRYWSFGAATRAPSPLYVFVEDTGAGRSPIDHPALVDALPGDRGYSAIHAINQVVVTAAYAGQRITTIDALADAIDLGLIHIPEPTGTFVASPIVAPGTSLDVGGAGPAQPETVYGRGYAVAMFRLGGARGVQPGSVLIPTSQVAFVREARQAAYAPRPIFQAKIPAAPATTTATYTPLCAVVKVDLAPGTTAASITDDVQLFERSGGAITSSTDVVARFEVTGDLLLLPLQFTEGAP